MLLGLCLSPQEAFMIYGFGSVSDSVAGVITIGICLLDIEVFFKKKSRYEEA